MKRNLTLLLILAISGTAMAQKLEKPKIDKLTGDTTITTSTEKIYGKLGWSGTIGEQLRIAAVNIKQTRYITLYIQTGKVFTFSIPEGAKIYFKTADNKVTTLFNGVATYSQYMEGQRGAVIMAMMPVKPEDYATLKANTISFIRVESSYGNFDYDIKEAESNKLNKTLSLF